MKAFRFTLEKVMDWRRTRLTLEEAKLERLLGEVQALVHAGEELERGREELEAAVAGSRSAQGHDLAAAQLYRERLLRQAAALAVRIREQREIAAKQQAAVTIARRELKLVERLKERRHEEWRVEMDREVETLAGEFAVAQWRAGQP